MFSQPCTQRHPEPTAHPVGFLLPLWCCAFVCTVALPGPWVTPVCGGMLLPLGLPPATCPLLCASVQGLTARPARRSRDWLGYVAGRVSA